MWFLSTEPVAQPAVAIKPKPNKIESVCQGNGWGVGRNLVGVIDGGMGLQGREDPGWNIICPKLLSTTL